MKLKSDNFYDTLKSKVVKHRLINEFFNLIMEENGSGKDSSKINTEEEFKKYEQKFIRNISFKQLEAFGPSIEDTSARPSLFVQRAGNSVYKKTSEKTLKEYLLFDKGDLVDEYTLSDNERIFRMLPFIKDARIHIKPISEDSDSVDIEIVVKDLWPYGLGVNIGSLNTGNVGLSYNNLFGNGRTLQNIIYWEGKAQPVLGYEGSYKINNIKGSFISSEFRYIHDHNDVSYLIDFHRDFLTPSIKYAGGMRYEYLKSITDVHTREIIYQDIPLDYSYYDGWIAKSFLINENHFSKKRTNLMIAGRVYHATFFKRPQEVSSTYLYRYHDRLLYLFSLGCSRQAFTKGKLIYSFGQVEDIPVGLMAQATFGFERDEYANRPYAGISLSNGTFLGGSENYYYHKISLGGYIHDNSIEQGTFDYTAKYFTQLYSLQRFKIRYFVNLDYKYGINRFNDEYITIENAEGISGLKSNSLNGIQKLTVNFEAVSFSPFYLNGFRFAFFFFANVGMVGQNDVSIFSNKAYSGLGVGIRLRNERLIFNTLQIRFAYYPVSPSDAKWNYIQFSGEERLKFKNFYISEPETIEY